MTPPATVAIVTGSSSGIGKAVAKRLLNAGYSVVLNFANDVARAETTLEECQAISSNVQLVQADISSSAGVANLIDGALEAFGRVDVLVNNAAKVNDKPALEMSEVEWDQVFAVNAKGAFLCAQSAARHMINQDTGGSIINIGASTGIRGRRNGANTCASKAALMMLTQCLALELGPKVRVNTVIPGLVLTDETVSRFNLNDPQIRQSRLDAVPMNRLGVPEDVADAVMLVLSPEAKFVTGQKLVVDGGQNMW